MSSVVLFQADTDNGTMRVVVEWNKDRSYTVTWYEEFMGEWDRCAHTGKIYPNKSRAVAAAKRKLASLNKPKPRPYL